MDNVTFKIITFISVTETNNKYHCHYCITIWKEQYHSTNYTLINKTSSLLWTNYYAWFTISSRKHETRQEWECEGYIHLVFHTCPVLVSSRSSQRHVGEQSRVKGNENVSTLSCSFLTRVWMATFMRTSSRSHLVKSLGRECKPGIRLP